MAHVYDAQSLVDLPLVKAGSAATIGTSIITAAHGEKKLAPNVAAALKLFEKATSDLKGALLSQLDSTSEATYILFARAEADAWSGLESFLTGFARLSIPKKPEVAAALHKALFSQGLTFLRQPTGDRWSETERRIALIKENELEAEFAKLGGSDFLAEIYRTHKAVGDAAGITAVPGVVAKSGVGPAFDRWKAASRTYVVQVVANHALDVATSEEAGDAEAAKAANELSERLLAAIVNAESAGVGKEDVATPPAEKAAPPADKAAPPTESSTETAEAGAAPESTKSATAVS